MRVSANTFFAEGSDLLIGTDPKAIAVGGAFVAATNDAYATYWNPAGIVDGNRADVSLSYFFNSRFRRPDFIGVKSAPFSVPYTSLQTAIAFSHITRLYVESSGLVDADRFESMFIDYALPKIPANFDGDITSKTLDYRFSIAISPIGGIPWKIGFTVGRINCETRSCGVVAKNSDNNTNWTVSSTDAYAWMFNAGMQYRFNDQLQAGMVINDIDTALNVSTNIEDVNGVRTETFKTNFPRQITTGLLWTPISALDCTIDYQYLYGEYGSSPIDFKLIRFGARFRASRYWTGIGGFIPLQLRTSSSGDVANDLPFPVVMMGGAGFTYQAIEINSAIYPDPIMSYQRRRPVVAAHLSIGYSY